MDDADEQQETSTDDGIDAQRSIIRQSLDEIANDIGTAMRDAHLDFPVGLTTPNSGHAIVTIVTPLDPSESDWSKATAIVRHIVSSKLGGIRLRSRSLPCAMVHSPMSMAEITANALDFDMSS
jgi:hypothetical protein